MVTALSLLSLTGSDREWFFVYILNQAPPQTTFTIYDDLLAFRNFVCMYVPSISLESVGTPIRGENYNRFHPSGNCSP